MASQKNSQTETFNAPFQPDLDRPNGTQETKSLEEEAKYDDEGHAALELGLRSYYGVHAVQNSYQALEYLLSAAYFANQKALKNLQLLLSKDPALATKNLRETLNLDNYENETVNSAAHSTYFFDSSKESSQDKCEKFANITPFLPNPYQNQISQKSTPRFRGESDYQEGNTLYKQGHYLASLPHFKKAAKEGYVPAYLRLARLYEEDLYTPKSGAYVEFGENEKQSKLYYQKVSDHVVLLKELAETGDAEGQFTWGLFWYYQEKFLIKQDSTEIQQHFKQAVYHFEGAANKGHSLAQLMLGFCYKKGRGVDKNLARAVHFFALATHDNCTLAQRELGLCYYHGDGVTTDFSKAARYFKWAADQDDRTAQAMLGLCYYYGQGVGKNLIEALRYLRLARADGIASSKLSAVENDLGVCYATGDGVNKDLFEAEKYFDRAIVFFNQSAYKNLLVVQRELGFRYEKGEGVPKDLVLAMNYFRSAANLKNHSQINELAIQDLKRLLSSHETLASKVLLSDVMMDINSVNRPNSDHLQTASAFSPVFAPAGEGSNNSMDITSNSSAFTPHTPQWHSSQ